MALRDRVEIMRRPLAAPPMTSPPDLPDDVRRFVLTALPTVPHLEAVLLFRGAPQERRTARDTARLLYIAERSAAELLEQLCEAGILALEAGEPRSFRYHPRDDALQSVINRLAAVYASNLIGVTNLIHDSTQKNAQRFAAAFRLRRDS
jgi:hypothetical protein